MSELTQILEQLNRLNGRLDVLEGRLGPPPVEIPPDRGRADVPAGVTYQPANGYYYRGSLKVCEDCWQPIPRYLDFPEGLVSPESDSKHRLAMIEGKVGHEQQPKAVCLPCYLAAFARCYPDAPAPDFSAEEYPDMVTIPKQMVGAGTATLAMAGEPTREFALAVSD